jgi:two-component system, NarL family, response regulator YdfI
VIRVFIVAASPLARSGLQNLLADRGVEVVGGAPDVESLPGLLTEAGADALVIDTSGENFESSMDFLASSALRSDLPVVVLAENPLPGWPNQALHNGIRAVLPVEVSRDQLAATLQAVTAGLVVLHPVQIGTVLAAAARSSSSLSELAETLTRREREVLQMLAAGLANKEIASRLNISDHTAKFHVASILGKLGVTTRTEAVTVGIRRGLVLL